MQAMARPSRASVAFCAVLLLAASIASAQIGAGRLTGSVKDERGRAVKGATVIADHESIAPRSLSAATDAKGRFAILGMRGGTWKIRIEAPGFHTLTLDVPIQTIRSNPPLDVQLARQPEPGPPPLLGGANFERVQRDLDEAAALVTSGQIDAAIAAYRRLLDRHPALTSVNLQLGYLLETKGDRAAALAAYQAALKADPSSAPARAAIERLRG